MFKHFIGFVMICHVFPSQESSFGVERCRWLQCFRKPASIAGNGCRGFGVPLAWNAKKTAGLPGRGFGVSE